MHFINVAQNVAHAVQNVREYDYFSLFESLIFFLNLGAIWPLTKMYGGKKYSKRYQ